MNAYIKLISLYAILALCVISSHALADNVISLSAVNELISIGSKITYLEDKKGEMTINEVVSQDNQESFLYLNRSVFSRPGTKSAFWFKVTVENHTSEDAWLELGSNFAWYIDFYPPDENGLYSNPIEMGTMRPDENKLYDVNFFWLPVNKAKVSQSITYYIRVTSGLTFELPMHVGTVRSLSRQKDVNDYLTAGFVGILIIMLLYNLFIYISIKDHIYLYYLGYLFVMIFSMPYANGYPFIERINFGFLDKSIWNEYFLVWHNAAYFFIGTFCIKYLDLKHRAPKLARFIQIEIIIISVVFPLLNIFGIKMVDLVSPVQAFILILYLTCLATGYYFVFKGLKRAYYYTLGWTFLVVGVFIFFGVINGFLPYNPITRNILYFGTVLEVGLFALALANRLNELRGAKEKAEAKNIILIRAQNEELERKVKLRTIELEETNYELLQSNEELKVTTEKLNNHSKQLETLNQTKDHLFAVISHDLRSPISSLKGILDLMYKNRISREEFLKFSIDAKHSVEQAHFMLNNLLSWAKFQLQGMSTKPEEIGLKQLIDENILAFNDTIKKKSMMVICNLPDNLILYADPNHINIIIRNLLSNALKFTETGGNIAFDALCEGDRCIISIRDSGVGISSETLDDIFTIRAGKSKVGTEGEKGTGLGLPLCKDFVEKNNGSISVSSSEGKGTTFIINLPSVVGKDVINKNIG